MNQDDLHKFIAGIDEYINNNELQGPVFNPEFREAELLTMEAMSELGQDELFTHGYMLLQYADHVNERKSKLQSIVNWCSQCISTIVAREYANTDKYAPYELKVAQVAEDNEVLRKIIQWRMTAQARMESLVEKSYIIKKKADCLIEKAKRR